MAQLAVALPVVGESRRSAYRRQRCRNKDHSQEHHYPSSYAHFIAHYILPFCHGWTLQERRRTLRDRQDFALNRPGVLCEPCVCRCSPISSHLESGSNGEIGHPSKGLNSHPPKSLLNLYSFGRCASPLPI